MLTTEMAGVQGESEFQFGDRPAVIPQEPQRRRNDASLFTSTHFETRTYSGLACGCVAVLA
jgi:hypothetical protein